MRSVEVLIVGGGPAGSTCAWQLNKHNIECLILDKMTFPRTKLCAGWITPEVLTDLEFEPAEYPHRFNTINPIRYHFPFIGFNYRSVQHSIRRYEFDQWLLERSGAEVTQHEVRTIERDGEHYIVDQQYRCKYLVGAGGTRCPVYRNLFKSINPRAKNLQVVTLEEEFAYDYKEDKCQLWFFSKGLPGYAWYVPKQNGYLNIGIGGMASKIKSKNDDIKNHWQMFTDTLKRKGLVSDYDFKPKGYSYFARGNVEQCRIDNAFILGDAAGLATRDICEGIGPAIQSGLRAADSIINGCEYQLDSIAQYSGDLSLMRKLFEYKLHRN